MAAKQTIPFGLNRLLTHSATVCDDPGLEFVGGTGVNYHSVRCFDFEGSLDISEVFAVPSN